MTPDYFKYRSKYLVVDYDSRMVNIFEGTRLVSTYTFQHKEITIGSIIQICKDMFYYEIARTDNKIDDVLAQCKDAENKDKTNFPNMTYEQGVKAGIGWVTGETEEHPINNK